jgi:hypothetical protein
VKRLEYYIVKSGMQMYDLSRAYGLGCIINKLSNSKSVVKDFGHYYLIENNGKIEIKNIPNLSSLAGEDLPWWGPFATIKGNRQSKIKEIKKSIRKKEIIKTLLENYNSASPPKGKRTEVLYCAMELSAVKGERKEKKTEKYTEGDPFKISKLDFLLSVIGHINLTIWKFKKEKNNTTIISILLTPSADGINIGGAGDIFPLKKALERGTSIHRCGVLPTLSNVAANLGKIIYEMKYEKKQFTPKFSSLIFGIMVGAGQQMKPNAGGVYSLDLIYKIIESTEKSGEIFDHWVDIFRATNRPGYEDLALKLSELITYPSEITLERYSKSHLRTFLSKDVKPRLYEAEVMWEVMKNV